MGPEARVLQLPAQVRPAIGGGGRLRRKVLVQRSAIAFGLILLLGLTKHVVASREVGPHSLSALPGGRPVAVGLDIGGIPTDYDLQALADSYGVDGVVNLSGASAAEQVATASLHQKYLHLDVASGKAPTWIQLRTLISFMQSYGSRGRTVYLHDDIGGAGAVATADMLLLIRGETWSAISQGMTAPEKRSLNRNQLQAIRYLISALSYPNHDVSPGNPYTAARVHQW